MWLLYNVAAIHELPLHIATKAFSTIDVFGKLNCYIQFYYFDLWVLRALINFFARKVRYQLMPIAIGTKMAFNVVTEMLMT